MQCSTVTVVVLPALLLAFERDGRCSECKVPQAALGRALFLEGHRKSFVYKVRLLCDLEHEGRPYGGRPAIVVWRSDH